MVTTRRLRTRLKNSVSMMAFAWVGYVDAVHRAYKFAAQHGVTTTQARRFLEAV